MGSTFQGDPSLREGGGIPAAILGCSRWALGGRHPQQAAAAQTREHHPVPGGPAPPARPLSPFSQGRGGDPVGRSCSAQPRAWVFRALFGPPSAVGGCKNSTWFQLGLGGRGSGFPCSWRNYRPTCCQEAWLGEASAAPSRRASGGTDGNSITRLSRLFDLF